MQIDFFSVGCNTPYKTTKPIRLIELFAGIGSQSKALERIQANFEHYRICEFDKYAVQSYNAIHSTDFKPTDITKITADDLGITETDKYEYIMTYSFPCTDLSVAGKQAGMAKGSGTRSGLLWEVERLLTECKELPQVLLMENVPQVLNGDFGGWLDFLDGLGYRNYYKCLNAKNYGIPQSRDRCFMVSVLGDYYYDFPKPTPLTLRLKDMLETEVEEKYYLSEKQIVKVTANIDKDISNTVRSGGRSSLDRHCWDVVAEPSILDVKQIKREGTPREYKIICPTITARDYKDPLQVKEPCLEQVADLNHYKNDQMNRVYSGEGIAPTVETMSGGGREPKVLEPVCINSKVNGKQPSLCDRVYDSEHISTAITTAPFFMGKVIEPTIWGSKQEHCAKSKDGVCPTLTEAMGMGGGQVPLHNYDYRIRKLTPLECYRLMGFDDADFYKAKAAGVSDSQLYKQAGNSIVVNVLEALFKQLF